MSASELERKPYENNEILRKLNQIQFNIEDEIATALEDESNPVSSNVDTYRRWVKNVSEAKDELEEIVRLSPRDEIVEQAEEVIMSKVVDPYIEEVSEKGAHVPSYSSSSIFETQENAIRAAGDVENSYLEDIKNMYEASQSIGLDLDEEEFGFTDYKNIV